VSHLAAEKLRVQLYKTVTIREIRNDCEPKKNDIGIEIPK